MLGQQTNVSVSKSSAELAEQATIRAVLNSYLRETKAPLETERDVFILKLPSIGKSITGELLYSSAIGQHAYGPVFHEIMPDGAHRQLEMSSLARLLLDELGAKETSGPRSAYVSQLMAHIENSYRKMSMHLDYYQSHRQSLVKGKLDCIKSEQSLYYGHPFHPYPKSAEGFQDEELAMYSPEMGAAFQLHYFAIQEELVYEEWLEGHGPKLTDDVEAHAKQQLTDGAGTYKIVPMHPWQAAFVFQLPQVQARLQRGEIISLGLLGPVFYPTSSVRTVWNPAGGYGYKLPLHVRITNLVRENSWEQARRTMDAAKVIHHLQDDIQSDSFQILSETGFSHIRIDSSEDASPYFTVIHRPIVLENESTYVVASLLESFPGETEPKLIQAIRQSGQEPLPDLDLWLERYLQISLLPLMRLLARRGISFEAHLQNSLVSLKNGWPDCYYVRDLEGVSIDRQVAAQSGWIGTLVDADSPVLYEEAQAWMRTKYYFIVNHLGSLIHTIAAYRQVGEEHYWRIVQKLLQQEKATADKRLLAYINNLLQSDSLPAKANLRSCFLKRGETPLFVDIPNPMKE
ncbi:IucA/IucC family protein [Brevibacillus centrosporus]|uniref:IucA/IucC family protein n=1 Tax=Brevibacillus centrosporus TaxID=54910 RepID=UPI003985ACC0